MPQKLSQIKKSLLINLFLFYVLYFAFILAERQLLRSGLFSISFPIKLDILETGAGFVIGSGIIVAFTLLIKEKQNYLRLLLISILILGSAYISIFINAKLFYPPFIITNPGDLKALGEQRWTRDLPYGMYADVYDQFLLHDVYINPNINNYEELKRVYRFGVNLTQIQDVPSSITGGQFNKIEEMTNAEYHLYQTNNIEYRLYPVDEMDDILITTYNNITLFIPLDWITE